MLNEVSECSNWDFLFMVGFLVCSPQQKNTSTIAARFLGADFGQISGGGCLQGTCSIQWGHLNREDVKVQPIGTFLSDGRP